MKAQTLLLTASLWLLPADGGDLRSTPSEEDCVGWRIGPAVGELATHARISCSRKTSSLDVFCDPQDGILYQVKEEVFARVGQAYREYDIDLQVSYNENQTSRYDMTLAFVEPLVMQVNGCAEYAGCADAAEMHAIVSTLTDNAAVRALTRQEVIAYYANVVLHETAHLMGLADIPAATDARAARWAGNIMYQDHFRSFSAGGGPLGFTPQQQEQMHTHLRRAAARNSAGRTRHE